MSNPLLAYTALPPFDRISAEHFVDAVSSHINACKKVFDEISCIKEPTWENFYRPQEKVTDALNRAFAPISHLNAVKNLPEIRKAYQEILPLLSEFYTFAGQHKGLYQGFKKLKDSAQFPHLSQAQKKAIEKSLRDFELSGIGLSDEKQKRFGEISSRLSKLSSDFNNNVLDATMAFEHIVTDSADLAGIPESAVQAAKNSAEAKGKAGYRFTLDYPSYLPVMLYADNQELRKRLYQAFVTRASDQYPLGKQWDNSAVIDEILLLRKELSALLGFNNYAERSLATKMAQSTEQVMNFLHDLITRSKAQGEREMSELRAFAKEHYDQDELNPWDIAYYSEKQKEQRYAISDEKLRAFFPENIVISGLFELVNRLYGISIERDESVATWHKDVKFYKVFNHNGEHQASFYLDLYAREHKRGGAWMANCVTRRKLDDGSCAIPVAFLTCNFTAPLGDAPALFSHSEVTTLFHEFGHGLHHMLSEVDVAAVAGTSVPWDAVELPSQFMENWCWQQEALSFISGHYQTKQPLDKESLESMLASKNYQSAMFLLRQLEFGLFDFKLHMSEPRANLVLDTLNEVKQAVSVVPSADYIRTPHSFAHIFAGGYAAGYYSYLWAEVLSADAFSAFEENGIFDRATGLKFKECILSKGGSDEPATLFANFRGRESTIDALLRHKGIDK